MEKKKCTICKNEKDLSEFNKHKGRKDGLSTICRLCSNKRSKQYYNENKERHKKVIRLRSKKQSIENRKKIFEYYLKNSCVDCGENDPVVLEFDHLKDKKYTISNLISGGYSWKTIENEINKCEVRCANCHRRKTAIQQG